MTDFINQLDQLKDRFKDLLIDPYEISWGDKKLGEGGFGIVYFGSFRGNRVAIKVMKRDGVMDIPEFEREVTTLNKFRSKYIIHFYGVVLVPNKMCMVTEYAQFGSLKNLMNSKKEDPISIKIRIKMMIDVAKGIEFLHSNNVIQRDIKPDNILVMSLDDNEQVNAKLTDFGLSRVLDLYETSRNITDIIGSYPYLAPEIYDFRKYNHLVDIYSLAITMYECFGWCECYPSTEKELNVQNMISSVRDGQRRPKPNNMSDEQYELIGNCWKQDPKERMLLKDVICCLEKMIYPTRPGPFPFIQPREHNLKSEEIKAIESWTQMKLEKVVFDSNVDDWDQGTSAFHTQIINKSNLIFLIQDDFGNKFGGYVNATININTWVYDPNAFLFSLKPNVRMKFDIIHPQPAFWMGDGLQSFLFVMGQYGDICAFKKFLRRESFCKQFSFNYNGIQNALCGTAIEEGFTLERITVVKLKMKK